MEIDVISFIVQDTCIEDRKILPAQNNEGARLVFIGLVRDYNKTRTGVSYIEYHAYKEMAEKEGLMILQEAMDKFEVSRIACIHRVGMLALQEEAIRLEICSGHRLPSIHACEFIMDEIKARVPIWKKEFYRETLITQDSITQEGHISEKEAGDISAQASGVAGKKDVKDTSDDSSKENLHGDWV